MNTFRLKRKNIWKRNPRLSIARLQFLCQQLSSALASGMVLQIALTLVCSELQHKTSRQFLEELSERLQQGKTLAQGLQQSSIRYPAVFLEFILAGEQHGAIQQSLEQAAAYFQQQQQQKQLVLSALCYPIVLVCLMGCAFSTMMLFVVPSLVQSYANVQVELPAMTKAVLACSQWMRQYGGWLWFVGILVGLLIFQWIRFVQFHTLGRKQWREFLLRLPVFGKLYQEYWFIQIAQGMGLLLSQHVHLAECLQTTKEIYRRSVFAEELSALAEDIHAGYSLREGLQRCSFVPVAARQVLVISEQTGNLAVAMQQLQKYYQQQFQHQIQRMVRLLEPCFVIAMGLMVLILASSLFLPLLQSYQYLL